MIEQRIDPNTSMVWDAQLSIGSQTSLSRIWAMRKRENGLDWGKVWGCNGAVL